MLLSLPCNTTSWSPSQSSNSTHWRSVCATCVEWFFHTPHISITLMLLPKCMCLSDTSWTEHLPDKCPQQLCDSQFLVPSCERHTPWPWMWSIVGGKGHSGLNSKKMMIAPAGYGFIPCMEDLGVTLEHKLAQATLCPCSDISRGHENDPKSSCPPSLGSCLTQCCGC